MATRIVCNCSRKRTISMFVIKILNTSLTSKGILCLKKKITLKVLEDNYYFLKKISFTCRPFSHKGAVFYEKRTEELFREQ